MQNIINASKKILEHTIFTPLLTNEIVNEELSNKVFLKCDNFQLTGSFKFRGALNAITNCDDKNIITYSSGNHGNAVAFICKKLGRNSTIIIPEDAPSEKLKKIKKNATKIIYFKREDNNREEIADKLISENGGVIIPPFDHQDIINGQATIALESQQQLTTYKEEKFDHIFAPLSGGGLCSSIALFYKNFLYQPNIYFCEPDDFARMKLKFDKKDFVFDPMKRSICDALQNTKIGILPYNILSKYGAKGIKVPDDEIIKAFLYIYYNYKIIIEPSSAIVFASLLKLLKKEKITNKNILLIISGANIDVKFLNKVLQTK